MSVSNTSSATTTRSDGSSSAVVHDSSVVLPDPGGPANTIDSRARTQAAQEARPPGAVSMSRSTSSSSVAERDAGELADVHEHMAAAGDVAVHDVDAGAVVELGVLQSLGRIELAVGRRRVVEQLGQRAHDVVVVVEDLVVVARRAPVPAHEHRVGSVDHDLPHVVVVEQRGQRPVAGEVAERPLDHDLGVGQGEGPAAAPVLVVPPADLVVDQRRAAWPRRRASAISSEMSLARSCTARSISTSGDGAAAPMT